MNLAHITPALFSIAIVVGFTVALSFLVKGSRRIKNDLQEALQLLRSLGRNQATDPAELQKINSVFEKIPSLTHSWAEFKETLIYETDSNNEASVYNTSEASQFFSVDAIMMADERMTFRFGIFTSVPQMLTSLGIIGTFATVMLSMPDGGSVADVGQLIGALKFAFASSLLGVLLSAIYLGFERKSSDDLEHSCAMLSEKINFIFIRKTAQSYLATLAKKYDEISGSIKAAVVEMGEQVASDFRNIATADPTISEGIKSAVAQGFSNLGVNLAELGKLQKEVFEGTRQLQQVQSDSVGQLVQMNEQNKIASASLSAITEKLALLAEQISKVSETTSKATLSASETLVPLAAHIATVKEGLDSYQRVSSTSLEGQERIITRVSSEMENLKTVYSGFQQQVSSYSSDNVVALRKNLTEFDGSIGKALGGINGSIDNFQQVVGLLSSSVDQMNRRIERIDSVVEKIVTKRDDR